MTPRSEPARLNGTATATNWKRPAIAPGRGPLTRADVVTADDVAALFDVPRARVLAWGREGVLPRRKLGRLVVFLREDVERRLRDG